MSTVACCVHDCSSGDRVLHRFPANPEWATEWRERLNIVGSDGRRLACCDRHFSDGQYENFDRTKPLKSDAVPDCNTPNIKLEAESVTSLNNNNIIEVGLLPGKFPPPPIVVENLDKLCRLCLETDEVGTYQSLFGTDGLVVSIRQSIGIEVDSDDAYPKQICPVCVERVNYIQRSREWFLKNDQLLKAMVPEAVSNEDLIIPDVVPSTSTTVPTEAIFFKEEDPALVEEEQILVRPTRVAKPSSSKATKKKPKASARPTSFCTLCSREFESPRDLRNHLYSAHQGVICKHCGVAYSHPGTLQMHIKKHHGEKERLAEWKEQAAKNLFREMAEKFNGGVQLGGGGCGGSEDTANVQTAGGGRSKRPRLAKMSEKF